MKKTVPIRLLIILIIFASYLHPVYAANFNNSLATRGLGSSLFDPNSYAPDDELNNLLGRDAFVRIDFLKTDSNINTNLENTDNTASNNTGNSAQVADASIARVAGVSTGTTSSLALSLLLSALATLVYWAYTQTGLFKKREMLAILSKYHSDKNRLNFTI